MYKHTEKSPDSLSIDLYDLRKGEEMKDSLGRRRFMSHEDDSRIDSSVNLEFLLKLRDWGNFEIKRDGGLFPVTTESIAYGLTGGILFRPSLKLRDYEGFGENLAVKFSKGEIRGTVVESVGDSKYTSFDGHLVAPPLRKLFPHMGWDGEITIATVDQLPGDLSQQHFVTAIENAFNRSSFGSVAKAYQAFLQAYG